jgi:hypothetical protein
MVTVEGRVVERTSVDGGEAFIPATHLRTPKYVAGGGWRR